MAVNLHLVCGSDDFLVEQKARSLVESSVPEADRALGLEIIDGRAESADAAVAAIRQCLEALRTPGFFGGTKLVWLKDVSFCNPQMRPGDNDAVKERLAELTAFLKAGLPAGQRLLLTVLSLPRNSAFFKACQAAGEVLDFGGGEKAWEQEKLAKERLDGLLLKFGLRMAEDVRDRFLQRTGTATRMLVSELEKLRLYLGRTPADVTAADVDAIVAVGREAVVWDLTDALGERDAVHLMQALRRLQTQDESAIGLAVMVEARVRELLVLRHAIDQRWLEVRESDRGIYCQWAAGLPADADRLLGGLHRDPRSVSPFALRKNAAHAKRYTLNELRRARHQLIELREKLVSSAVPPDILLETTLLRLVARRAPAAAHA
jgi:DNA polymerase III delta subunit